MRDITLDNLIERQIKLRKIAAGEKKIYLPVLAISREMGSGGSYIAKRVAEKLGFDFYHKKLVDVVSTDGQKEHDIIKSMDEKVVSDMDFLINSIIRKDHLDQTEYLESLMKVILIIAVHGSSVIVGRGAYYILGPQKCFRVRILCNTDVRIQRIAHRDRISLEEAEKVVKDKDKERRKFIEKYLHKDIRNPLYSDLIINTEFITPNQAAEIIATAYKERFGVV